MRDAESRADAVGQSSSVGLNVSVFGYLLSFNRIAIGTSLDPLLLCTNITVSMFFLVQARIRQLEKELHSLRETQHARLAAAEAQARDEELSKVGEWRSS